ncbi:hypothetical protein QL991_29820, partial [Bacillus mycoides]|nr:hypothetical protein [Bacillus mycoides]
MDSLEVAEFELYVAQGVRDTEGRTVTLTWDALVEKLSIHKVKNITVAAHEQYKATKPKLDKWKDGECFVGGKFNGTRSNDTLVNRSIATLDIDTITDREALQKRIDEHLDEVSYVLYSTFNHTPDNPRLRLIIPLDKPVSPSEYKLIAIALAAALTGDGNEVDPCTEKIAQVMYLPAKRKDAEHVFEPYEPILGDAALNTEEWIVKAPAEVVKAAKGNSAAGIKAKLPNDESKPDWVRAFNTAYPIEEAIVTFLSDVYEPCEGSDDRYTLKNGSTVGGLILH